MAVSGLFFVGVSAVVRGNSVVVGLFVLLALVGGPMSLLYLWPLIHDPDQRPSFVKWPVELRSRWTVVASLLGALALVLSVPSGVGLPLVFLGGLTVSILILGIFTTDGEIDPEARTIRSGENEIDLDGMVGIKHFRVRGVVLCWLSFPRGRSPQLIVLPSGILRDARTVFDDATVKTVDSRDPNRTVQVALLAFSLLFFAIAFFVLFLGPETADESAVLVYAAVLLGFFGVVFAGVAVYEA